MKKTLTVLTMILLAAILVVSCEIDTGSSAAMHTVTLRYDEKTSESFKVPDGEKFALPESQGDKTVASYKEGETTYTAGERITVKKDMNLTAVFKTEPAPVVKTYCTLVVISKDTVVETKSVEKNTEYTLPQAPQGTGFNGWKVGDDTNLKKAGEKIKITADTTVKADWTAEPSPVYYSLIVISKENVIDAKYVVSGTKYTLPAINETGFRAWSVNGTETAVGTVIEITSNTTVKAVFEKETPVTYYAVSILSKDTLVKSEAVAGNSQYTLPEKPAGSGTFGGWLVGESAKPQDPGTAITINTDTVIRAKWSYTVTFSTADGSIVNTQTVEDGSKASKPDSDPTRYGYTFERWSLSENGEIAFDFDRMKITEDTTLYAVWKDKNFTVTFVVNPGDTGSFDVQTVKEGAKAEKPKTDPKIEKKVFDYWSLNDPSGESTETPKKYDFNTAVESEITLYAVFRDYAVGDTGPAGGVIFYIATDTQQKDFGWKYLEAAAEDCKTSEIWGGVSSTTGTETEIGKGKSNTEILKSNGIDNYAAAKACIAYSTTVDDLTYKDWFLPSKDELHELYKAKGYLPEAVAQTLSGGTFWSSSESSDVGAYAENFSDGTQQGYNRSQCNYHVRAIRSFN